MASHAENKGSIPFGGTIYKRSVSFLRTVFLFIAARGIGITASNRSRHRMARLSACKNKLPVTTPAEELLNPETK